MVTLDDLPDKGVTILAKVFQISYRGELVPQELFESLSKDALQYYVDEMEKIREGV